MNPMEDLTPFSQAAAYFGDITGHDAPLIAAAYNGSDADQDALVALQRHVSTHHIARCFLAGGPLSGFACTAFNKMVEQEILRHSLLVTIYAAVAVIACGLIPKFTLPPELMLDREKLRTLQKRLRKRYGRAPVFPLPHPD